MPTQQEKAQLFAKMHEQGCFVLANAWDRAEREDAHDLAGSRLPENLSAERAQSLHTSQLAADQFNAAVTRYNEAIAQFPAALLAWLFGFQAGRGFIVAANPKRSQP